MDLSVKGYFRKYLKNYKMSHKTVSLDGAKYSSDKGTKKEKKLVDYISDNNNPYDYSQHTLFILLIIVFY